MLKINIVTELNKVMSEKLKIDEREADAALASVIGNFERKDAEENDLIQYFGTATVIKEAVRDKKMVALRKQVRFLSNHDIRKVCWKYNLRFLPAELYKKEIPKKALSDLREFKKQFSSEGRGYVYNQSEVFFGSQLYMIAPKSHFKLGPRPSKDPVLLYDMGKDKGFKVVSTWGNDFSALRRVQGVLKAFPNILTFIFLVALIVFTSLYLPHPAALVPEGLTTLIFIIWCMVSMSDGESLLFNSIRDVWDRKHV